MSDKYSILVQARNRETEQGGGGVVLRMTYIQPVDSDFCRSSNLHTRKSQMKDNSARTRLSFLYLITYSTGNNYMPSFKPIKETIQDLDRGENDRVQ